MHRANSVKFSGPGNPFYGKKHSRSTKRKLSRDPKHYTKTREFSEAVKRGMKREPNRIPVYEIWLEKYGKREADRRDRARRRKWSNASSGKKNPMYGKPAPQGSGNGWSGWYNEWFFRSLRELSYVVLVLEAEGHVWVSAESSKYRFRYKDHLGFDRTYTPDFLVDSQILVECKPRKLWNSPSVLAKARAARRGCRRLGLRYEIVDPALLSNEQIASLRTANLVKFTDRYEAKFIERFSK